MREIKFRAWDMENHQMFYVDFHVLYQLLGLPDPSLIDFRGSTQTATYTSGEFSSDLLWRQTLKLSEWMQYTGLKDKHGKEIYEGDIVLCDYNNPAPAQKCTIQWGTTIEDNFETGWWLMGQKPFYNGRVKNSVDLLVSRSQKYMEIIGNIYENPELASKASGAEEE